MKFDFVFIAIGKASGTFAPTTDGIFPDKVQKKNFVRTQDQQQQKQQLRYRKHKNTDVASNKAKDHYNDGNIEPGFNEHITILFITRKPTNIVII
jgi:hypothetical protein